MESFRKSRLGELLSRRQSPALLARSLAITLDLHWRGGFWTHSEDLLDPIRAGNDGFIVEATLRHVGNARLSHGLTHG